MLGVIIPSVNEAWNIVFLNRPDLCTMKDSGEEAAGHGAIAIGRFSALVLQPRPVP